MFLGHFGSFLCAKLSVWKFGGAKEFAFKRSGGGGNLSTDANSITDIFVSACVKRGLKAFFKNILIQKKNTWNLCFKKEINFHIKNTNTINQSVLNPMTWQLKKQDSCWNILLALMFVLVYHWLLYFWSCTFCRKVSWTHLFSEIFKFLV